MNKTIDRFLAWWLRTGRYGWSKFYQNMFERKYLSFALPEVNGLTEIKDCLSQVTWTMDGPLHLYDSISYPEAVWARKKDDCDGFAILAAALLRKCNSDSNPVLLTVIMRPVRLSHTVCVFMSKDGKLGAFDNASLHDKEYQSYEDVARQIAEHRGRLVCWDVRDPKTFDMIEFHKS
jgi:hypothetical protein